MFRSISFIQILLILSCSSLEKVKGPPQIKDQLRHIIFQAGRLEHKPWNPFASYAVKVNFNGAVFTKLLYIGSNHKINSGIIIDWTWDEKDQSYLFEIDTSLMFDKDRHVTAKDVEFAILKNFISTFIGTDKRLSFDIRGVEKLVKGSDFISGMCEGVTVLSDSLLKVNLNRRSLTFLPVLSDLVSPVAPIEDFEHDMFTFNRVPRGTGNFKVIWSDPSTSMVRLEMKEYERISDGHDLISFDIFNHGLPVNNGVDIGVGAGAKGLRDKPGYTTIKSILPIGISVIDFNYTHALGSDINFRRAVSLAINRDGIYKHNKFGNSYHELIPSKYYGRAGLKFHQDLKASKALVQKYFGNKSSKEHPLKGIYHGSVSTPKKKYVIHLESQLRTVGIHVEFFPSDGVYFSGTDSDSVMSIYGVVSSYVDPLAVFSNYLPGVTSGNNTGLADAMAAGLFKSIKNSRSRGERSKFIKSLSKHFHDQVRQIPPRELFQRYVISPKVKGLNLGESITAIDFTKVEISY